MDQTNTSTTTTDPATRSAVLAIYQILVALMAGTAYRKPLEFANQGFGATPSRRLLVGEQEVMVCAYIRGVSRTLLIILAMMGLAGVGMAQIGPRLTDPVSLKQPTSLGGAVVEVTRIGPKPTGAVALTDTSAKAMEYWVGQQETNQQEMGRLRFACRDLEASYEAPLVETQKEIELWSGYLAKARAAREALPASASVTARQVSEMSEREAVEAIAGLRNHLSQLENAPDRDRQALKARIEGVRRQYDLAVKNEAILAERIQFIQEERKRAALLVETDPLTRKDSSEVAK